MAKKSWAEIVLPSHLRIPTSQPKVEPVPVLCQTCKQAPAIVCSWCKKRPVLRTHKKETLCGGCHCDYVWRTLGSESMCIGYIRESDPSNDPPLHCRNCSSV